ncbi:glycosyltransferase family 4 protein [Agromyces sp. MMS24-K17]|uniref:glycosyltransferase family 4 protein n=1 Tax=Agromyces sp. MMS24-K17 TaxID=3372850 RepID=UPI003753EBD7
MPAARRGRVRRRVSRAPDRPDLPRYARRGLRLLWEQVSLPRLARREGVDVVLSPHYTMPLVGRFRRVVTLHDATFFSDAGLHLPVKAAFFRTWIRYALRHADAVVVPSAATASELRRFVPRQSAAVHIAHHGVDFDVFRVPTPSELVAVRSSLGIGDRPYVAFLGTLEPRKNVTALIDAMPAVAERLGPETPALILAGATGWDSAIDEAIDRTSRDATVLKPGYLPLEQLRAFLNGALAVVYPSLGEGFGLPVVEAMASGAYVITTRRLALPEVGGDAVDYSDVDARSIADRILVAAGDPVTTQRLREAAESRASTFTWEASARVHLAAADLVGSEAIDG